MEMENVDVKILYCFFCQYFLRSIVINQECNVIFICYMVFICLDFVLDKNLYFFGLIFEIVVDLENENEVLIDIIDMDLEEFDEESYLYCINQCIRRFDDDLDLIIFFLFVIIFESVY